MIWGVFIGYSKVKYGFVKRGIGLINNIILIRCWFVFYIICGMGLKLGWGRYDYDVVYFVKILFDGVLN